VSQVGNTIVVSTDRQGFELTLKNENDGNVVVSLSGKKGESTFDDLN